MLANLLNSSTLLSSCSLLRPREGPRGLMESVELIPGPDIAVSSRMQRMKAECYIGLRPSAIVQMLWLQKAPESIIRIAPQTSEKSSSRVASWNMSSRFRREGMCTGLF